MKNRKVSEKAEKDELLTPTPRYIFSVKTRCDGREKKIEKKERKRKFENYDLGRS